MLDAQGREKGTGGARQWAPVDTFSQVLGERRRGRLLRHYFLISVLLIGGGLITSGLWELYLRYHEIREHIGVLQQQVAAAAAFKIGQFIQEIHGTLKATTRSREVTARGLSPEYRFELERLLLLTPAITEAVALDARGVVRGQASRLRTVLPEGKRDFSTSEAFQRAKQGQSYFGPVYFFRDAEPYMTIAVPIEHLAGQVIGVLQAEVSVIFIGENVVSAITVGETGYAYVVSRSGDLIAHPEVNFVLQRRRMVDLEHVREALQSGAPGAHSTGSVTRNLQGEKVLSSYAAIPKLDWIVFIERPAEEVYRLLSASMIRTSTLLLLGLGMALVASVVLARRVLRPLETLRNGVERIGKGDLAFRLDLKTGDEIEILADEFNKMAVALQEAYSGLEQKVMERTQELISLNQRLEEANRLKSRFLANVSHELRTPLNAIIGFTRIVLRKTEGQVPRLQHENLRKVLISAEHLLNLINGLLDLSKIEADRMEVFPEPVKLDEVIQVAAATVEPMLKDSRVQLVTQLAPGIPVLNTDRQKLKQIVLNLLSNAAKFTEKGEIRVSAWQEHGLLKLTVSDTGIGMKQEALAYIFDEFRQVDMSSTRKYQGTGLGLAIVKRLVHLLGGEIEVESELGKGSTFSVAIPTSVQRSAE